MYYFIITGKQTCYSGWKAEYTGFLMTSQISENNNKNYACVDKNAESIDSDTSNKDGAVFYGVRTTCGLRCPPYKNHTAMMCVVCTTQTCYLYTNKNINYFKFYLLYCKRMFVNDQPLPGK